MCVAELRSSFWKSVNKGFKGPFVNLRAHSRVWIGSMLYKAFCLVYHGSSSNNREHPRQWESGLVRIRNVWMFEWVCSFGSYLGTQNTEKLHNNFDNNNNDDDGFSRRCRILLRIMDKARIARFGPSQGQSPSKLSFDKN